MWRPRFRGWTASTSGWCISRSAGGSPRRTVPMSPRPSDPAGDQTLSTVAERAARGDYSAYGSEMSQVYDMVYIGRGKDFAAEARVIADIVRTRRPDASSLLDVGCGTGQHLLT